MGGGGMGGGGIGGGIVLMPDGSPRDAEEWTVKIETASNQAVTGKLRVVSVAVQCDLGLYEIKPDKVKEIQFTPTTREAQLFAGPTGIQREAVVVTAGPTGIQREAVVVTASGEKIAGMVGIPQWWRVRTDLGILTPDVQRLKSLTFVGPVEPEPGQKPQPASGSKPRSNQPPDTETPGSQPGSGSNPKTSNSGPSKPNDGTAEAPK